MADRTLTYFVSDVHLGLDVKDPEDRERRFVKFLRSIPPERTEALYMLGDIWDFWYEYRDVVPKGYVRVFSTLMDLMDAGVKVYFFQGNHDIWCYWYFKELGMQILQQPYYIFRFGQGWSKHSRVAKNVPYAFRGDDEPLYVYSLEYSKKRHVDYFIFGHFHCKVDMTLPSGARLLVLKDWMDAGEEDYFLFNSADASLGCFGIS